jgi:hypothetical protein
LSLLGASASRSWSPGFQERRNFAEMADHRHPGWKFFFRAQGSAWPDEDGLHAVGERLGDVVVDPVPDEQLVRPGKSGGRYICELLVSLPDSSAA